jgi:urease accessory protein
VAERLARLAVERIDGLSAATTWASSDTLKLMLPCPRGDAVVACAATYGGGLVGGDRIILDLEVAADAALTIGTQSTTKVYRSTGADAEQHISAHVADGALLASLPEPVSCFADSRFVQRVAIDLAPTASLAWLDAVSAGRVANDEAWCMARYDSRTDLRLGGRLIAREALRLDRSAAERFASQVIIATLWLIGPRCAAAASAATELARTHQPGDQGLLLAASPVTGGCVLRGAAISHETLNRTMRSVTTILADQLGDAPWLRLASVEMTCT